MEYALNAEGRWTADLFFADAEDPKMVPPAETHVGRFKSQEPNISKSQTLQ